MGKRLRIVSAETGSALVETAISLPLLLLVLAGSVDLGRVFYTSMALTNAARAGAQYGAANLARSGEIANMESKATGSVNVSGVTATASRLCQCATDNGSAFSSTSPSANNCTAPAATSCPGLHRVVTVTVTATKDYSIAAGYLGPDTTIALSRTATLRVTE